MNPVDLVTVHHEGAGTPSDVPRGADGGYSYWIGASRWEHLRDVWHSYATLDFNHVSLDICLSGNRMTSMVTDPDIALIHGAFMDARARGYVTATPTVRAHKNSPGSSTVCPGANTMARWNDVVLACRDAAAPIPPPGIQEELVLIPSPNQPDANQWRGAVIDVHNRTMVALGGAVISPPLDPVEQSSPWVGVSTIGAPVGSFVIVADTPDKRNNAPYRHTVT